jgi:hypothetical protein
MERWPDKFKIVPQIETQQGPDLVYEDDPRESPFIFEGRLRKSSAKFQANLMGDLTKTTHTINAGNLDFQLQEGMTITDVGTETQYELLFFVPGKHGTKLWLAIS